MGLYCLSSFSRKLVSRPLVRHPGPGWLCWWGLGRGAHDARHKWPPGGLGKRQRGPERGGARS
eukprot:14815235-Alexandrium_andersonii.AAC.1